VRSARAGARARTMASFLYLRATRIARSTAFTVARKATPSGVGLQFGRGLLGGSACLDGCDLGLEVGDDLLRGSASVMLDQRNSPCRIEVGVGGRPALAGRPGAPGTMTFGFGSASPQEAFGNRAPKEFALAVGTCGRSKSDGMPETLSQPAFGVTLWGPS